MATWTSPPPRPRSARRAPASISLTGTLSTAAATVGSFANTLEIFPGRDFGDVRSGKITTLVVADAEALEKES